MERKNVEILRHCVLRKNSEVNKFLAENEGNNHESVIGTSANSEGNGGLCRICANTNSHLVPIFEGEGSQLDLITKIHKYLPIQVTENDGLPKQLCYECTVTIIAFHDVAEGCLEAEQKLIQLQEGKSKKNSEEQQAVVAVEKDENSKKREEFEAEVQEKQIAIGVLNEKDGEISQETASVKEETERSLAKRTSTSQRVLRRTNSSRILTTKTTATQACSIIEDDFLTEEENDTQSTSESRQTRELPLNTQKTSERPFRASRKAVKFFCLHCNFSSKLKKSLNIHMCDTHPELSAIAQKRPAINKECYEAARMEVDGKVYYHCKDCGKNLFSPYTFSWHMRIHTGERPFTCHLCGKQFRVNQGLARHLKETHARIKNFPCDICNRMFATKRNVEDHRRIHTGERPYICNVCGKTFKQKASLFVHNRTHSDIFPFKCNHCEQVFRTRPVLMVHVTKHTGEKPHLCDICGRAFRIKHELKRHRLIHSDEKPWKCTECGLGFRQKRYLVNHKKNHNHSSGKTHK